ncbi:asparaginase [Spiribacter vilamensis]|uniref:L-asparaginase n=1 Tax=Spiribacter vilamensis TaxID=531306 RepID=A0A4Q8CZ38_9GAMM|nr:asparaginase [Spiribacter vilamensis]RZU98276.1 L-asparaginase [Spiribacter vilamensis]TVO60830.1 asparaginase [Spiribacter vilamensis]
MIHLLTTGGTIASTASDQGRNVAGALSADHLMERIGAAMGDEHPVQSESLLQKPSNAISLQDLWRIAERCEALLGEAATEGIVITHGTDTLEDTAWFLQQALGDCRRPVVVTGSQRALHETGSDAPRNLVDAIRAASAPESRGQGVLVVFDEEIHSATLVRKMSSYRLAGFGSPGYGPIGQIDGAALRYALRARPADPVPRGEVIPRVDILTAAIDGTCLIDAAVTDGARGLVIDALGRGQVPPDWVPAIERASSAGIPIAVTSSTGSGPVRTVYEYIGSLESIIAVGALPAGALTARQARILLIMLLSAGASRAELAAGLTRVAGWPAD